MPERISTLDDGYETGQLSLFPDVIDDKDSLYQVSNNAETVLKAGLGYNGKTIIARDTSGFPDKGILRVGAAPGEAGAAELIYYGKKTNSTFQELVRGFAGSRQNKWSANAHVTNAVTAEPHNAVKDALINIQTKVGLINEPAAGSLHALIKQLEVEHLAPKPLFRGFPRKGSPSLTVRFQNFSGGDVIRFLWDFGDGSQSIEKNPTHTYQAEGNYTVKLNVITSTGAQGIATKSNYISVSEDERIPFFYSRQADPTKPPYSVETAAALVESGEDPNAEPAVWNFVDQTDGDIIQRFWVFDDGETESINNPSIHSTNHVYQSPGVYEPSLLALFSSERLKRVFLTEAITVT